MTGRQGTRADRGEETVTHRWEFWASAIGKL
jgi:hypothetical protein